MTRHASLAAIFALLLLAGISTPALATALVAQDEVLTNSHVLELTRAGLSPSFIVTKIRSSKTKFDLSTSEVVRLKKAGVRDEVLEAMMQAAQSANPSSAAPAPTETPRAGSGRGATDAVPSDVGIYWLRSGKLIQLEPTVYSKQKTSGLWKSTLTGGIMKARFKAVVAGRQANMRVPESTPTFMFYFGNSQQALGPSSFWPGATSANEFILLRLDVEDNSREAQTGEANAFGASVGVSDKQVREFDFEKLDTGLYRVRPRRPLESGEYCFFYGGGVGWSKVFDFSVTADGRSI
jgi:hypothetical protein